MSPGVLMWARVAGARRGQEAAVLVLIFARVDSAKRGHAAVMLGELRGSLSSVRVWLDLCCAGMVGSSHACASHVACLPPAPQGYPRAVSRSAVAAAKGKQHRTGLQAKAHH